MKRIALLAALLLTACADSGAPALSVPAPVGESKNVPKRRFISC